MGATGMFVLGGLLQGAGQAITNNANALREQALLNLKREYDVEDRNYNADQAMQRTQAEIQGKKDEIGLTVAGNIQTQAAKAAADAQLTILKGQIDLNNEKTIKALEHTYNVSEDQVKAALDLKNQLAAAGQTVDHWAVTTDGKMVAFNKQGGVLRYSANPNSFVPTGAGNADNSDITSLLNPSAAKGGGKTAPASAPSASPTAAQDQVRQQALARLPGLYMQIEKDPAQYKSQYPGMFDANGNLLPIDVLKDRINQRYGAQ